MAIECCPSIVGSIISLRVELENGTSSTIRQVGIDYTTTVRDIFRLTGGLKFTTEGDFTIKFNNYNIEDRSDGRGHRYVPNNSYMEGTVTLVKPPFVNGGCIETAFSSILGSCGLRVFAETSCGKVYAMINASETGEGSFNAREGTSTIRFSSAFPVRIESGGLGADPNLGTVSYSTTQLEASGVI